VSKTQGYQSKKRTSFEWSEDRRWVWCS